MQKFNIRNISSQDPEKYEDFMLYDFAFNPLNDPVTKEDFRYFWKKYGNRQYGKIVFLESEPVFLILAQKDGGVCAVKSMIVHPDLTDDDELQKYLRENVFQDILDKLSVTSITYQTSDNELNEEFLKRAGFEITRTTLVMNLDIKDREVRKYRIHKGNISYRKVSDQITMEERLKIQNDAFQNRKRVPLSLSDVEREMNFRTYIPELGLLMYDNGEAIGYGQIIKNSMMYYLVNFGIRRDMQKKGYGDILLTELLDRASVYGAHMVNLEVFKDNPKAINLYSKHGFLKVMSKTQWKYGSHEPYLL